MKLRITFALLLAGFICGCSSHEYKPEPSLIYTDVPPSIKLEIRNWVTYELPIGEKYLNVSYHENSYREEELGLPRPSNTSLALSEGQRTTILSLLDAAVTNMPLRDNVVAPDGTIWELESRIFQEVTFTVWTPSFEMGERGYNHLIAFENYLSELANEHAHNK